MKKLKMVVVSEKEVTASVGGCGKHFADLCGARSCDYVAKDD
jgi:hypothetical protein